MSEKILKALMQLFAIIARPEQDGSDRRTIVEAFLQQQLNKELVKEYVEIFDNYYEIYQKKSIKSKREKNISLSSVKVLKICTEINQELTQKQRLVVLFRLYEFIKIGGQVTAQELIFVSTVADVFNINEEEYLLIKDFVLYSFAEISESDRILVVDDYKKCSIPRVKHLFSGSLNGQIHILSLSQANMYILRYKGENELYLNGQLVEQRKIYVLTQGSSLRGPKINPIYYSDIVSAFNIYKIDKKIVFSVKDLEYEFKGGKKGLEKMNFTEESGQLIGIMGGSGAGKTTLLNVLNGINKPNSGEVLINGINIHNEKDKIEGLIGFVSQDDLLIEELTVFQNLYYNAKLCFDNYNNFKIIHTVLKVLQNLGLYHVKDMIVGTPLDKKISGGQRKRLNIALELIREPAVLFLDEPTSGLSSRDSEIIMDLLKELTLKGKLVFVVIHQPSSDLFKMFDKLLIIDMGGYLIYKGNPVDSIMYFKTKANFANWSDSECPVCGNVNPEQIFNIVESRILDEFGNVTQTRKISPNEWNSFSHKQFEKETQKEIPFKKEIPEISFKIPNKLRQFKVFITRDVLSKLTNKQYLIINIFETPLLAFSLAYIIKYYSIDVTNKLGYTLYNNSNLPVYIFMAVIIAIFVGLTVSAEEIIKDRKILKREKFLNLSWSSYLLSKVAILFILSALQSLIFVLIGNSVMEIKGMFFQYWLVLFSSWAFANLLGLNISDSFKTAVTIYILIPFLIIPQLILSGIIVQYDKLNPDISSPGTIPFYGEIITARWAYEALSVYQYKNNEFEKQFYPYDKIMSVADYKKNYWLRTLSNKTIECERYLNNPDKKDIVKNNLTLLRNEIKKELEENKKIQFNKLNKLYYDSLNKSVISDVNDYFSLLNKYYIKLYNKSNQLKDEFIAQQQLTKKAKCNFIMTKKRHMNRSLSEFVCNSNSLERIVEYKGHLYQKINPIYHDPESKFIKAHFYAPRKKFFGNYYNTFCVNVIVIWAMNLLLYLTLYFRISRRLINSFTEFSQKKILKKIRK